MTQFFYVPDTQGKVSNNEREELVRELRRELGLEGGGGGGRGKSLQVPKELEYICRVQEIESSRDNRLP